MRLPVTPSQTVGPFLHIGLDWLNAAALAGPDVSGECITIEGRVLDADGNPVPDALIEIWQADAQGRFPDRGVCAAPSRATSLKGFGRVPTDDNGTFRFMTIKPGRVPAPDGTLQAPHIVVTIFMRGLLRHLVSRIYFPGEAANAEEIERNWGQNTFCATTSSGSVPNSS
jgi:protocatechuate 3,4-dioxygenase alpha subunit